MTTVTGTRTPLEWVQNTLSPIPRSMENEKVGLINEGESMMPYNKPLEHVSTSSELRVPVSLKVWASKGEQMMLQ